MRTFVSVVIATKNREAQLRACLQSLLLSRLPPDWATEVLVVDNASTDDTVAVVASFQRAHQGFQIRYLLEARRGKSFAVNTGTASASGAIIAFVDDDVVVSPNWVAELIDEFSRDPGLGLLAGRVVGAEQDQRGIAITRPLEPVVLDPLQSLAGLVLGCNLAVRPEVIAAVGGRDTRLGPGRGLSAEDIDFVYRVLRAGFRGRFSPRPVVIHRPGPRNRGVEYPRGRGAYYIKFILRGDLTIARQAWWELNGLWRDLWQGAGGRPGRALDVAWQLSLGAGLMAGRMLLSLVTQRRRRA